MLKGWSIVLLNGQNILDFAEWDPNLVVELAKFILTCSFLKQLARPQVYYFAKAFFCSPLVIPWF